MLNYNESQEINQDDITSDFYGNNVKYINDFSGYKFALPECVDYDAENLSRTRNDSWWNPFTSKNFTYHEVKVKIPLVKYYKTDYTIFPNSILSKRMKRKNLLSSVEYEKARDQLDRLGRMLTNLVKAHEQAK